MATARDCAEGVLSSLAVPHAVGGPWWAGYALAVLALLAFCLRTVIPQDSKDRLALLQYAWPSRQQGVSAECGAGHGVTARPCRNRRRRPPLGCPAPSAACSRRAGMT